MTVSAYVQVPVDNVGKKIATQEVTRADGVTVVERQEVIIADPGNAYALAAVGTYDGLAVNERNDRMLTTLDGILRELRAIRIGMAVLAQTDLDPATLED